MSRTISRWLPVLAVSVVLTVLWLAATLSAPDLTRLPAITETEGTGAAPSQSGVESSPLPPPTAGERRPDTPDWLLTVATYLCGAIVVALIGLLAWYLLRNAARRKPNRLFVEPEEPEPMAPRADEEVLAAVDAGLDELSDSDIDPRRAVIACWVRLEQAAASAGTPRHVGDSPTDLVTRLLHAHQVSRPALDGLARAYREARYATHPIDERSRQNALAALRQLRAELGRVPSA